MKINEIVIKGIRQESTKKEVPADDLLFSKGSFLVEHASRDSASVQVRKLDDDDIIELVFEDGTTWFASPESLGEIFPKTVSVPDRSGSVIFEIPAEITAESTDRGFISKAFLKLVNIYSGSRIKAGVSKLAQQLEDKQLDKKPGLFRLDADFRLLDFKPDATGKPYCLLIHGTASSVSGSFGEAKGTDVMDFLVRNYADRILAFQHRTLTENPLQNVRDLLKALPDTCTLHLVTTSRGGLVGEILSRFCNAEGNVKGFSTGELAFMKKEYPEKYYASIASLVDEIRTITGKKNITVEKFIRIACPARGTTLASGRLDGFLNIALNLIGNASPAFAAFRNLVAGVINSKNSVDDLPGLEAQNPASPLIKVLNGSTADTTGADSVKINNSLVVISGNSKPALKVSGLLIIASKLFFLKKNDLVVDTFSMSLGTGRTGKVQEYCCEETDINHFKYFSNNSSNMAILKALESPWGESLPDFEEKMTVKEEFREGIDLSSIEIEDPLLEAKGKKNPAAKDFPVKVSVSQGDLYYASYPIMAGHFEDDGILFAEINIDENLKGMLSCCHQLGIYPGPIGSSEVFLTENDAFKGAVIVGLGKPGNLTAPQLTVTIEQGVINYILKLWHHNSARGNAAKAPATTGMSSLIIGCGYAGLSIENSIKAIIQGVYNANAKLRSLKLENVPVIEHLEFIELYEDKAVSSLFSLSRIENEKNNAFRIIREGKGVKSLLGYKTRIPSDETEAWWNRISVNKDAEDKKNAEGKEVVRGLKFRASTRSSREEEQKLYTTPSLMEKLISDISTSKKWTPDRARAIFELLIPNDFKDQLKRHGNIIWVLDEYSATYPWELLQDSTKDAKPICITSGMIRQLSTSEYSKTIRAVTKNNVLVVADPDLEGFYSQLSGARTEGKKVAGLFREYLKNKGGQVTESSFENHTVILEKMFRDDYKIIHLSGHGTFNKDNPEQSGMVIGKNQFLSTREIKQMSNVPELVFVNCCHLGKTDGMAEELFQERYKLAANVGTQLINNGVRCVVAAGWAVDDKAAEEFADVFYDFMFKGATFGKAVLEARQSVFEHHGHTNTWGAYQCYGDPFYKLENKPEEKKDITLTYLIEQQAEIDLLNLHRELEIGELSSDKYLQKLDRISRAVDEAGIRNSKITELEALIFLELREYDNACIKFRELLETEDSAFSFSVAEKYYNARAKKAIETCKKDPHQIGKSLEDLNDVIINLETLIKIIPTSERLNILGSSYKRKAFISNDEEKIAAYKKAAEAYLKAYRDPQNWYSLTNWLILESILIGSKLKTWNSDVVFYDRKLKKNTTYTIRSVEDALKVLEITKSGNDHHNNRMSYWDLIAGINIHICEYILLYLEKDKKTDMNELLREIKNLWELAGSKGKRFAEIEHLEFIIDALSMVKNKKMTSLVNNFSQMNGELLKLI